MITTEPYRSESPRILSIDDGSRLIFAKILSGQPLWVSRVGIAEFDQLLSRLNYKRRLTSSLLKLKRYVRSPRAMMMSHRNRVQLRKIWDAFAPVYLDGYRSADVQCIWTGIGSLEAQFELFARCAAGATAIDARAVEPYLASEPWSAALADKRVLVVSPFANDFKEQHKRRHLIWPHGIVLPSFQFIPLQARFYSHERDRMKVLEAYKEAVSDIEFDVALLACSSIGLPLGSFIRDALSKQAIYVGGALQILFGVRGSRWDSHPLISDFFNEYWLRPSDPPPPSSKSLDDFCYW